MGTKQQRTGLRLAANRLETLPSSYEIELLQAGGFTEKEAKAIARYNLQEERICYGVSGIR